MLPYLAFKFQHIATLQDLLTVWELQLGYLLQPWYLMPEDYNQICSMGFTVKRVRATSFLIFYVNGNQSSIFKDAWGILRNRI